MVERGEGGGGVGKEVGNGCGRYAVLTGGKMNAAHFNGGIFNFLIVAEVVGLDALA